MRAIVLISMISIFAMTQTACIGTMGLTGKVREWNLAATEDRWGREGIFFLMYVIPVYPTVGMIDLLFINSVEFWSGTNPVNGKPRLALVGEQEHVVAADGAQATSTLREDGSIDIDVRTADGSPHFVNIAREEDRVVARDAEGRDIAAIDTRTGEITPLSDSEAL